MEVEWGTDFDLILLPNFLHHFDFATCTSLLRKLKAVFQWRAGIRCRVCSK